MKKLILFCLPFLYCLILLSIQDKSFAQDLGRHIKMGEIILSTHSIPVVNLFSYTEPLHPFINHHWLSEVVFYVIYTFFGASSLIGLKIILIFASFGIVYYLAFRKQPFLAFLSSFFYLYLFSYRFDVRPELFSFLFISLFVFLISYYQENKKINFLLPLPFIELLWVNIHIYFIVGIILFGCLILSESIERKKVDIRLLLLFMATVFATFVNPQGIIGALEPLTILKEYGYAIVENQSIFFLNTFFFSPHILIFELLALVFVSMSLINLKKINVFLLSASTIAIILSIQMVRNFPIFVLVSFPLFVVLLSQVVARIKDERTIKVGLAILTSILVLITAVNSLVSPRFGLSYIKGAAKAVDYFEKNNLKGPIFNNFDIGSYLDFRLYPKEKVFVDGRPEAYSVKFFDDYKKMQLDPIFFEQQVKKYNIRTIFFAHTEITDWGQKFLATITKDSKWERVYLDESIVILTKK